MKLTGNYSQIPNPILNYLPQLDMPLVAKDIVWAFIRLTYGFHRHWVVVHNYEIARRIGYQPPLVRAWIPRLVKFGVLLRGRYTGKSSRKYKPRYVYAVNPYLNKWAVFKRAGFYKTDRNDTPLPDELFLLTEKYQDYFHQPADEKIYYQLRFLLQQHSSKRILGIMKKAYFRQMSWEKTQKVLQGRRVGCPVKT